MVASAAALAKAHRMKRAGTGYIGACSACGYEDALSVTDGDDGRLLLHCHVGCAFEVVARVLGKSMANDGSVTRCRPMRKIGSSANDRDDVVQRLVAPLGPG